MTQPLPSPDKAITSDKPVFFLQGDPTAMVAKARSGALIPFSPKMNKVNGYCTPVFLHPAPAGAQRQVAIEEVAPERDCRAEFEVWLIEVEHPPYGYFDKHWLARDANGEPPFYTQDYFDYEASTLETYARELLA